MKITLTKKTGTILLKVLITFLLLALIFDKVDFNNTISILKKTEVSFIIFSLVVVVLEVFIATLRWVIVLSKLEIHVSYLAALRYLWMGVFFNQALPSSIGGDALRGYFLCKNENCNVTSATIGVLLDRIFGILGLIILMISTSFLLFDLILDPVIRWGLFISVLGALILIIIAMIFDLIHNKWMHFKIIQGMLMFSKQARKVIFSYYGLSSIVLSLIIQLSFVLVVWILASSIGLDIELLGVLLVIPATNLLMALPISIAGWGVREGVMVMGFGYLGVDPDTALALSILYGLLMLVVALPGLIDWLWSKAIK
jgi:uncharacterized protein (TIRG00374 family)